MRKILRSFVPLAILMVALIAATSVVLAGGTGTASGPKPEPTHAKDTTPKPTEPKHTPKPTEAKHTPEPTEAKHTPKPTEPKHTPEPTEAKHTPEPTHVKDADGDGIPDEKDNCPSDANPDQTDTDKDGLGDVCEGDLGTDPKNKDTDGDGCTDGKEMGTDPDQGGKRDPLNPWDYFNPTHDGINRVDDVIAVVAHYGHDDKGDPMYSVDYDRTMLPGGHPWQSGPPDGAIRTADITEAVLSYGNDCA